MTYLEWHLIEGHRAFQGYSRVLEQSEMKKEKSMSTRWILKKEKLRSS